MSEGEVMRKHRVKFRSVPVLVLLLLGAALLLAAGLPQSMTVPAMGATIRTIPISTIRTLPILRPWVTSTSPASGATGVAYNTVIQATFSGSMDAATFTAANFYVVKSGGSVAISASIAYDTNTNTATLIPSSWLAADTTYVVNLTNGITGAGGALASTPPNYTWAFTTAPLRVVTTSSSTTSSSTTSSTTTTEPTTTTTVASTTTTTSSTTTTTTHVTFTDVPADSPYAAAIASLAQRTIISGIGDGTFHPGDSVKRQQFAKMIVRALQYRIPEALVCPFNDVWISTPGHLLDANDPLYPDHYIDVAALHGVTEGKTPLTFAPYADISRFQVATMVVRGLDDLYPGLLAVPPASFVSTWDPGLSPQHGLNARRAEYNGLLAGLPLASLNPFDPMPRGEVAQTLYNLLQLIASASS